MPADITLWFENLAGDYHLQQYVQPTASSPQQGSNRSQHERSHTRPFWFAFVVRLRDDSDVGPTSHTWDSMEGVLSYYREFRATLQLWATPESGKEVNFRTYLTDSSNFEFDLGQLGVVCAECWKESVTLHM